MGFGIGSPFRRIWNYIRCCVYFKYISQCYWDIRWRASWRQGKVAFAFGELSVSVTPPLAFNTASVAASNLLLSAHAMMVSTIQFAAAWVWVVVSKVAAVKKGVRRSCRFVCVSGDACRSRRFGRLEDCTKAEDLAAADALLLRLEEEEFGNEGTTSLTVRVKRPSLSAPPVVLAMPLFHRIAPGNRRNQGVLVDLSVLAPKGRYHLSSPQGITHRSNRQSAAQEQN